MAAFSPLQVLVIPFVLLVALPMALCAGLTTILAFLVLFFRLFLTYFDVGLETLRFVVMGHGHAKYVESPPSSLRPSPRTSPIPSPVQSKRCSLGSESATPSVLPLTPSTVYQRDFEGLGGWRADSNPTEEHVWESLNSRFQKPDQSRHRRTSSSGGISPGMSATGWQFRAGSRTGPSSPGRSPVRSSHSPTSSRGSRTSSKMRIDAMTSIGTEAYFPSCPAPPKKMAA